MAELGVCRTCGNPMSSEAAACPNCGQPDAFTSEGLDEVKLLARRGKKVQAIGRFREITGQGLKDGKHFVDRFLREEVGRAVPSRRISLNIDFRLLLLIAVMAAGLALTML